MNTNHLIRGGVALFATIIVAIFSPNTGLAQDRAADARSENGANGGIGRGGGAQADFDTLIDLIQSTIAPETWEDVGGEGSVMGFPGGVFVDPSGVLQQLDGNVQRQLGSVWDAARIAARTRSEAGNTVRESKLRKVSLTGLERELRRRVNAGETPTPAMRFMAGLHRVDYVVVDEQNNDVILAGPAGAWTIGTQGRVVHQQTGRPVVRMDDLIVLLRNAFLSQGRFVCTITPTQKRLARTQAYVNRTSQAPLAPNRREEWLGGLRDALGNQQIDVQGIPSDTRVARVIVEADHHMKLIGIGLEPGTDQVVGYLDQIELDPRESPPDLGVLRWWFTLREHIVRRNANGDAYHLAPRLVRVLSENELLTAQGARVHTGQSDELNRAFARSFTRQFHVLAKRYPIYAELDNIFRLATIAALLHHDDVPAKLGWPMNGFLADDQYSVPRARVAKEVTTVINHRVINRRHVVAAVSGGVSFEPRDLLNGGIDTAPERIAFDTWMAKPREGEAEPWWWD